MINTVNLTYIYFSATDSKYYRTSHASKVSNSRPWSYTVLDQVMYLVGKQLLWILIQKELVILNVCKATADNRRNSAMQSIAAIEAENIVYLNSLKLLPVCRDLEIQLIHLNKIEKFWQLNSWPFSSTTVAVRTDTYWIVCVCLQGFNSVSQVLSLSVAL